MAGHTIEGLIDWLHRDEWLPAFEELLEEHVGEACDAIDGSIDDLTSLVGAEAFSVVWGCVFEDFLTRETDDSRNIVVDYLKRRGFRERASDRMYMNGLRNSVMSLYEISDLRPGASFLARDLIRGGEPVLVSERSASRQLKPWDRLAARTVRVGSRTVMGGGALPFDHETANALLGLIHEARKTLVNEIVVSTDQLIDQAVVEQAMASDDILADLAPMFTAAWLRRQLDHILRPAPPKLSNSDGDDIRFTTIRYPLLPGIAIGAVRSALNRSPVFRRETTSFWNWISDAKPTHQPRVRGKAKGLAIGSWMQDGSMVLGTIELRRRSVLLEVNSAERSVRGQALIGPMLDGLTGAPEITTQTLEELKASNPRDETVEAATGFPAEQQAVMREWVDQYYRALLDEPVPMLGDRTPRDLARETGRVDELVTWLKFMENGIARAVGDGAGNTYDLAWMWEELGIAELRR